MKKATFILSLIISAHFVFGQQQPKVVLHLQSSDSLVHKSIVNQIGNLKKEFPQATIELVCHGPGLDFLLKKKSNYVNKFNKMALPGVTFVGCEFTMSQKHLHKEDLVPFATTVPFGLAEIVKKQQENWLYVKVGF